MKRENNMPWIKVYSELWDSWKIPKLADRLGIGEVQAVGHLISLWAFVERNAWRDGDMSKWGPVGISRAARWTGDADAFIEVLQEVDLLNGLSVHEWEQHQSSMIHDRERRNPRHVPAKSPLNPCLDKSRVDKSREEEDTCAFDAFWQAYPRKTGKAAARAAWQKKLPSLDVCLKALEWQKAQPQWTKDGGQFIPHASTWINQARYEDERPAGQAGNGAAPKAGKYDNIGGKV